MRILSLFLACLLLFACHRPHSNPHQLLIGSIAGPESSLMREVSAKAQKESNLSIKIVEFNDYNLLNEALAEGSLDANLFQHLPYLKEAMNKQHYDFVVLGKTFIYPMGIYSQKFTTLEALPEHAFVAIPNDPSNERRALCLLEKAGLIKLKEGQNAFELQLTANPKNLRIKRLDAAQLAHVLPDVDLAVINTNFAVPAGLQPHRNALYLENKDSPYANLMVIRKNTEKLEALTQFLHALQSKAIKEKAKTLFEGAALAAW